MDHCVMDGQDSRDVPARRLARSVWDNFIGRAVVEENGPERPAGRVSVFMDAEAMKEKVRANLHRRQRDIGTYYKSTGIWPWIATHPVFEKITLTVIALNAVWIGVETDWNGARYLLEAEVPFQIGEQFFCIYFALEWAIRFNSFQKVKFMFYNTWFLFDAFLVFFMILETWVLSAAILITGSQGDCFGNASILRILRLVRLTRMARMAHILRSTPELMILIKGLVTATRSVSFTLILLVALLYVFAIAFTVLTEQTPVGYAYFSTVAASMYALLLHGTLMDDLGAPLRKLAQEHYILGALYLLFVLFATVCITNMLIGVLCEVVTTVASIERETLMVNFVKEKMTGLLQQLDQDGNGTISKSEFGAVLDNREIVRALDEIGVEVEDLADLTDVIFSGDEEDDRDLTFGEFMEMIIQFRGQNTCKVRDLIDFHKSFKGLLEKTNAEITQLKIMIPKLLKMIPDKDRKCRNKGARRCREKRRGAIAGKPKASNGEPGEESSSDSDGNDVVDDCQSSNAAEVISRKLLLEPPEPSGLPVPCVLASSVSAQNGSSKTHPQIEVRLARAVLVNNIESHSQKRLGVDVGLPVLGNTNSQLSNCYRWTSNGSDSREPDAADCSRDRCPNASMLDLNICSDSFSSITRPAIGDPQVKSFDMRSGCCTVSLRGGGLLEPGVAPSCHNLRLNTKFDISKTVSVPVSGSALEEMSKFKVARCTLPDSLRKKLSRFSLPNSAIFEESSFSNVVFCDANGQHERNQHPRNPKSKTARR